jgi:hypothetical protein
MREPRNRLDVVLAAEKHSNGNGHAHPEPNMMTETYPKTRSAGVIPFLVPLALAACAWGLFSVSSAVAVGMDNVTRAICAHR